MKKHFFGIVITITLIVGLSSCRKDFTVIESFGSLDFSKDTIYLDTIFSTISSSTYTLKVYNKGNKTINVPKIYLENGSTSNYRLNIDGIANKSFENIEILANDSIYVFIEATINSAKIDNPLYTDRLLFDNGNTKQDVDLVTLVKDAVFIYPNKNNISQKIDSLTLNEKTTTIKGRFLTDEELVFTKAKPYVIYGYAAVPSGKTLTIEKGTELFFHEDSGIIIDNDASLKVNGTLEEKVTFQGDRLEYIFENKAGQWGTIWLRAGSKNNEIHHAQIKNAVIGVLADSIYSKTSPSLKIDNTEIYNSGSFGLLARQSNIEGFNVVIGNSGESCFYGSYGGSYSFTHCTFANFSKGKTRVNAAVSINDYKISANGLEQVNQLNKANFTNCIITGNNPVEFTLDKKSTQQFNYNFKNCFIRFNDINKRYSNSNLLNFEDTTYYQKIILNGKINFKDPYLNNFSIDEKSDVVNKGLKTTYSIDLLGKTRKETPDIGAYEHIIFQ